MPRENNTSRTSPVGSFNYWGEYAATADLPNASAGIVSATNFLNRGDMASVAGEIYVCTDATQGAAVWREVIHSASTLNLALTGTASFSGALTPTGGVAPAGGFLAPVKVCSWQPIAATSGTDTTPADGTHFVVSVDVPCNITVSAISYLIGSVGGTDKVYAAIYTSGGALVANSSVAGGGATVGTAAQLQSLALTANASLVGPARYYVGVSMNGTTARLRTVPIYTSSGLFAGSVAQTHGTVAAITVPTTFTDAKGPVVFFTQA